MNQLVGGRGKLDESVDTASGEFDSTFSTKEICTRARVPGPNTAVRRIEQLGDRAGGARAGIGRKLAWSHSLCKSMTGKNPNVLQDQEAIGPEVCIIRPSRNFRRESDVSSLCHVREMLCVRLAFVS